MRGRTHWLCNPRWDAAAQARFRRLLARRPAVERPLRLRLQALALENTGKPALIRSAMALHREVIAGWPDHTEIIECVGRLGDRSCLKRLQPLLRHPWENVRRQARKAIAAIRSRGHPNQYVNRSTGQRPPPASRLR